MNALQETSKTISTVNTEGLSIDLSAVRHNYRAVCKALNEQTQCSAVIKADAYGLGMEPCANIFYQEGCRFFFVASLDEALDLKSALQNKSSVNIAVLHGLGGLTDQKSLGLFAQLGFIPVLNSLQEIEIWQSTAAQHDIAYPAILHVDTGMHRFGLSNKDFQSFLKQLDKFPNIVWRGIMSHLACADQPAHLMTEQQYQRFHDIQARFLTHFPNAPASLANSAGIFHDPKLHFDLVRPGAALYGLHLHDKQPKMKPAMFLNLPILNIQTVAKGKTIGYGATYTCTKPTTIATIPIGYAGGYLCSASNQSIVYCRNTPCPVIGRISMDLITVDVSEIADNVNLSNTIEIIGENQTADDLAKQTGTIGYEIITALGKNKPRRYLNK